uniref:Uncharacterized protein n=1 Tax=Davidia involucrata TaxID=16924 RepID=A0A5B6YM12_DAVIN
MADLKGNNKRLTINLSLFAPYDPNNNNSSTKSTSKSPKNFEPNGVVGLGIVAAMNELDDPYFSAKSSRAAILALSPRSTPIPILNNINNISASAKLSGAPKFSGGGGPNLEEEEEEDMELSEGYTCVISHVGNNLIKKREYFDGHLANGPESTTSYWVSSCRRRVTVAMQQQGQRPFRLRIF